MTKEKERYDKEYALYEQGCDKYYADIKKWEERIEPFLLAELKKQEPTLVHHNRDFRYRGSYERFSMSIDVSYTMDELQSLIGKYPEKPDYPSMPAFLSERNGYSRSYPSTYQAVYQAITLLGMSDDEYVNAATYQMALEVL